MLTALTRLGALNVPATVDLKEMESTAQVIPTVGIFFGFKMLNEFISFLFRY